MILLLVVGGSGKGYDVISGSAVSQHLKSSAKWTLSRCILNMHLTLDFYFHYASAEAEALLNCRIPTVVDLKCSLQ